jgi:hypothetical protein
MAIDGWVARTESKRKSQNTKATLAKARVEGEGKRGKDKHPCTRKRHWLKRRIFLTPKRLCFAKHGSKKTTMFDLARW